MLKEIDDILENVYKAFPYIEEESIKRICRDYLKAINRTLLSGEQMYIREGTIPSDKKLNGMIFLVRNHSKRAGIAVKKKRKRQNEKTNS